MATTIVNNFISPRSPLAFIVNTALTGTGSTANNQFRIPHRDIFPYNYIVDWGDGVVENIIGNTSPTHTYPSVGSYEIKIWGRFAGFAYAQNSSDSLKLINYTSIDRRNNFLALRTFADDCRNLESVPEGLLNTKAVIDGAMTWSFRDCRKLTSFPWFDSSMMGELYLTWGDCRELSSFPLINTSSVSNFREAWLRCKISDFPMLDTSNGTNFINTWWGNTFESFPELNLKKGNVFLGGWRMCPGLVHFPPGMFHGWTGNPALGCFSLTWWQTWNLSSQSVENILVSIDASGKNAPAGATGTQADITVDYDGSGLTQDTLDAIDSLKLKGWKPHINGTYV